MGSGEPLVPLPVAAGVGQKTCVTNIRKTTESQSTVLAMDCIVEVNEGITSEIQNLRLEYTPKQKKETAEDVIPTVSQGRPVLEVGEVRPYLALQNVDGNTTGWIETKVGVDDMEESITLDQRERILRKRQKQHQYPGVGMRSRPRPMLEDVEDRDERRPVEIDINQPDTPDNDTEAGKGSKKGGAQKRRRNTTRQKGSGAALF